MSTVTKGEREMIELLAQYDGIAIDAFEADERTPEAQGYFKAVKAMIDAGLRLAYSDNLKNGAVKENASSAAELVDALAKHSGYPAAWLDEVVANEGAEGKAGVEAAQAKGYKRACAAMAAAGLRGAWVDDRLQTFDDAPHGYMTSEKKISL